MSQRRTNPLSCSLVSKETLSSCRLVVIEGPDRGKKVSLEPGSTTIGADGRCDLVLSDEAVSSLHAEVFPSERGIQLRDRGSTNGTFYLESRVHDAVLRVGSTFRLGRSLVAVLHAKEKQVVESPEDRYGDLLGTSPAARKLFGHLARLEGCEVPVLLEGETGTGKTVVARQIHHHSPRATGPFIVLDCGAVAPTLLASELFGHRRGSFTGANEDRAGVLEMAHGGTLVLEEVGEMPLDLQPALLRCCESGTYARVGESRQRKTDTRIIAATNRDLLARVRRGDFRADLFYRLAVVRLHVPSLRQRVEDIPALCRAFLQEQGIPDAKVDEILSAQSVALLQSYRWPGNIRQLKNAVARLALTGKIFDEELGTRSELHQDYHSAKSELLARFERNYLLELMLAHEGNLSAASRASGVVRHHLRVLLKKNEVHAERFRPISG